MQPNIAIGGLTPFSTLDYPNHLAAVIFCQGCPWRCGYCHNTHLLSFKNPKLSWDKVYQFLQRRRGLLDSVVFSGGEPLMQKDLAGAMQHVKNLGFKIALHTTGMNSIGLKKVLPFLDWISLDIKAPFNRYDVITGVTNSGVQPLKSAKMILESGISYEFHSTVHPRLLSQDDLLELANTLSELGVKQYTVNECRTMHCFDRSLEGMHNSILRDEKFVRDINHVMAVRVVNAL